jgi:type I restriction enzyme M protein
VGQKIRTDLMNKCDLHTILRLPTGIFYAAGVKTNVLFFTKGPRGQDKRNTDDVWVYDMRTNVPVFGKRNPLTAKHFEPFVAAFGEDPLGKAARTDEGEEGRWRKFTREWIADRADNLDITWLRDDSIERAEDLPDPEDIAGEIMDHLRTALEEMEALTDLLSGGDEAVAEVSA